MCERPKGLVITGFMGSGKSSIGKSLSRKLGKEHVDLDEAIEKEAKMTVRDIFAKLGEDGFRRIEKKTLMKVLDVPGRVISTGGGTVTDRDSLTLLKSYGMVICLWAEAEEVQSRLKDDKDRPLIQGKDRLGKIRKLMEERARVYRSAGEPVHTGGRTIEEIADEIADMWRTHCR